VERALVYPAVGTLFGCWLGIIPIALDWDRPWQVIAPTPIVFIKLKIQQAWPLTPAFGAISGYILASLSALTVNVIEQLEQEQSQARLEQKYQ